MVVYLLVLNGNNQPTEQKVTKSAGDTLMLGCGEYNSVPEATVTWIRRDLVTDIQKQSLGDNVATSVESGILYFRNLEKSHNGLYQCVISNSLTDNSIVGSYILTVNGEYVHYSNCHCNYLIYRYTGSPSTVPDCITAIQHSCKSWRQCKFSVYY